MYTYVSQVNSNFQQLFIPRRSQEYKINFTLSFHITFQTS